MTVLSIQTTASGDDGVHRSVGSHVYNETSAFIQAGFSTGAENLAAWMRFLAVTIPQGSIINTAKLTLVADRSDSLATVVARIDAEATDDAGAPTHAEFDGGSVASAGHHAQRGNRTANRVLWSSVPAVVGGQSYDTPDFRAVVQEIIDRPGWLPGNAITIYLGDEDEESTQVSDTRRIWSSYDDDPVEAPTLVIDYTAPSVKPAEYQIILRDPRTLASKGILGNYEAATWTRRALQAGEFTIHVATEQLDALSLIDPETVVEIRRDGVYEFAGVCTGQEYDAITGIWTLTGPDLKFFLGNRQTDPGVNEFDAQIAVAAETAMIHYVEDHLTAPTDGDRDVNGELTGITFDADTDQLRGADINYNARWQNLLEVLVEIGDASAVDLWYDVVILDPLAYQFQVYDYTDATAGTGATPVVFSIGFDNVGEAVYVHDSRSLVTSVYVLGPGSGASRTVLEVKDTAEETAHFRREGRLDSRQADSADIRAEEGNREIARSVLGMTAGRVAPLIVVEGSLYRTDWDLGYDVTLAFPVIDKTLDQRIVGVTVTLSSNGEEIGVEFDSPPRTLTALIAQLLKRSQRVQVA